MAGDLIAAGSLVRPFDLSVPMALAYYLVYPPENAGLDKVVAFRDWIVAATRDASVTMNP